MIHCTHVWDMLHDFCIHERYDHTQSLEQLIPCFVAGLFFCTYVPMTFLKSFIYCCPYVVCPNMLSCYLIQYMNFI